MRQPFYPSDLTDAEWQLIAPLLTQRKRRGKQREVDLREVVNAIFYRADNGLKWRAMPADFPAWQTVYSYYRKWVRKGVWETLNAILLERVRSAAARAAQPSLAMVDSQSVKQAQKGGKNKGSMDIKRLKDASAISWSM